MIKKLEDFNFNGKTVLIRVDFNVPIKDGKVKGDDRIKKSLPTIKYIKEKGGKIILMSHLGRPKGKYNKDLSLRPVAQRLSEILGEDILFIDEKEVVNKEVKDKVKNLKNAEIALLENLRFRPEEEKNEESFSKDLASLADIYVNDAFGTAHRAHASNVGVSKFLPSAAGFLLEKEIKYLKESLENPKRPFVAILGGAKVSDKINLIKNLLDKIDSIVIVGAMANTFIKSMGKEVGKSLVEDDKLDLARQIIDQASKKGVNLILPEDFIEAREISDDAKGQIVDASSIDKDKMVLDIGPNSLKKIKMVLKDAKTIVWNGPAGVFEVDEFSKGTVGIAKILADSDDLTIVGGGDSVAAVEKAGVEDKISHISTGGGASLELLEGKVLPAIKALGEANEN